jgi:hypothetical protein
MNILPVAEKQWQAKESGDWQKLARRRYQKGSIRKRGTRDPVWELQYWADEIRPDGSLGRKRESVILGFVSSMNKRQAMKVADETFAPAESRKDHSIFNNSFSGFYRKAFYSECFSNSEKRQPGSATKAL